MVSSFSKFEHRFPFLKFGHYKCPKMKSRKKSLKKKIYKTINWETGLKTLKMRKYIGIEISSEYCERYNKLVTTYYVIFNKN